MTFNKSAKIFTPHRNKFEFGRRKKSLSRGGMAFEDKARRRQKFSTLAF